MHGNEKDRGWSGTSSISGGERRINPSLGRLRAVYEVLDVTAAVNTKQNMPLNWLLQKFSGKKKLEKKTE